MLLARTYAIRHGYSGFGFVPFVHEYQADMVNGTLPPIVAGNDPGVVILEDLKEVDSTLLGAAAQRLLVAALDKLHGHIREIQETDTRYSELLRGQPSINHRQRGILAESMSVPDSRFRIRPHQTLHDISYPTARSDFLALEEMGYMEREQEGLAFVFRPAADLPQQLARLSKDTSSAD